MEIRKIQNTPSTSFTALKLSDSLPEDVAIAITKSRAFKKFGKKYDAFIDSAMLQSTSGKKPHPTLMIEVFNPANLITRIASWFKGKKSDGNNFMYFSTRGYEERDLINKIQKVSENHLINKFESR